MFKWWLHHIYKYSQVHNTKTISLNYFKNTLNIIVHFTITGSLKTIDSWQISRKLKIWCQNISLFWGFTKFQVKITWFQKIGFKIPLFLWNLEHTLDHKSPPCFRPSTSVPPFIWEPPPPPSPLLLYPTPYTFIYPRFMCQRNNRASS